MSQRALVTGVAGFMGRHVAQACLDSGMEVTGLDDLSGGFMENIPNGIRFINGSVTDDSLVRYVTETTQFDFIYHLAAYAAEGLSHFIRRFNYLNNVLGSVNLVNAAVRTRVRCFLFTSSIAVYGSNQLPMTENLVPQPEDPYGIAKYAVELDLRAAHETFGLEYVIFRPHNVFGEYQNIADRYRNVVGIFMNQTLSGEPMTVFGDGLQTRAFSYVGDVAPIIARSALMENLYGDTFNVGADQPCTVLDLARMVADALSVSLRVAHLPPRNEVVNAYASHEKLRAIWPEAMQQTSLPEGIGRMARWAQSVGSRPALGFKGDIEIHDHLPSAWQV